MKLTYQYDFLDFITLFPPKESLRTKPGPLYLGIIFSVFLVLFGAWGLLEDINIIPVRVKTVDAPIAIVFVLLGAALGFYSYWSYKRGTKKLREKYQAALREKFQGLHCRNHREIELGPD